MSHTTFRRRSLAAMVFALLASQLAARPALAFPDGPGAIFYYDANYTNVINWPGVGTSWGYLAPIPYSFDNPDTTIGGNQSISSVIVGPGWSVAIWTLPNYSGSFACLEDSSYFLDATVFGFNDNVRSFRVFNVDGCVAGYNQAIATATPTASLPPTPPTPTATETATASEACPAVPVPCRDAGKSSLALSDNTNPAKRKFKWTWAKGALSATAADFGDPVGDTPEYRLCLYDESGGVAALKLSATIDAGGTCLEKPCWKPLSDKGWSYKNKLGNAAGITAVKFSGGEAGKPSLRISAKGVNLAVPSAISATEFFDQDSRVIVQLHASALCWQSQFGVAGTKKNVSDQFKAIAP